MLNFKSLKILSQNLTLLFVEDDNDLRSSTGHILSKLFKVVDLAKDGKDGLHKYKNFYIENNSHYDIVISDIQMPILNGIEMSKAIFSINKEQKILITSAYSDKSYFIELINLGVDGFMQKPLSTEHILSTLYDVCNSFKDKSKLNLGSNYTYDCFLKSLFLNEKEILLSDNELKILDLFITNPNQYFSPEDIFNHIYFDEPDKEFSNDSIKSLIKRLRKKIPINIIINNYKSGYSIKINKEM